MSETRLLYFGNATLANGFRLAGFEVYADADVESLEQALLTLQRKQASAFIVLDDALAACDCDVLDEVREEGGRILVSQVPPLGEPAAMSSALERRFGQMFHPIGDTP